MQTLVSGFEARIARQALLQWARSKTPIDRVLADTLREHRVGSQQRALTVQAVYNMVRFWPLFVGKQFRPEDPAQLRAFDAAIDVCLRETRSQLLDRHLKAKPKFDDDPLRHLAAVHGLADFLAQETTGAERPWHLFLHQMLDEAPVTIRINRARTGATELLKSLGEDLELSKDCEPSAWLSDEGLHFHRRLALTSSAAYKDGLFEIQDEHSQLVGLATGVKPGMRVLDLCAGGGGKTLQMASMMGNKGEICAYDLIKSKLTDLGARARRAGYTNIRTLEHVPTKGTFDVVLVDAPCSGLGTLRRAPDRIYRFAQDESPQLAQIQLELIKRAKSLLAPGGKLIYATCTVRPRENWAIVNRLLETSPELKLAPLALPAEFVQAAQRTPAAQIAGDLKPGCLQWGPSLAGEPKPLRGDGFFIASLERQTSAS